MIYNVLVECVTVKGNKIGSYVCITFSRKGNKLKGELPDWQKWLRPTKAVSYYLRSVKTT